MTTAHLRASRLSCFEGRPNIKFVPVSEVVAELGLGEGRTNQNFIASDDEAGIRWFVRIGSDLPAYGVTRAKEQAAAKAAAASGVGATVVHAELPDALVTSFVDGRALTEAQVKLATNGEDDALLGALMAAIRRLHDTPLPSEMLQSGTTPEALRWAPPDLMRWIEYARKGGFNRLSLLDDVDALINQIETECMPPWLPGDPRFCHFDLLPDNFVVHDTRGAGGDDIAVTIVDFEYADVGVPLMDLAVLSMGCGLDVAEENRLVSSYLQCDQLDEGGAARFHSLKLLATLRETMWGVVAEVSGASALTPEQAAAYTDMNFEKHQAARAQFEANVAAQRFQR